MFKRTINPNLEVGGILLTLVNKRTNLSKETIQERKYWKAVADKFEKAYNEQYLTPTSAICIHNSFKLPTAC